MKAKFLLGLAILLSGCTTGNPFHTGSLPDPKDDSAIIEEGRIALDKEADDALKQIRNGLKRGVSGYRLSSGDRLEVLFHFGTDPEPAEYVLGVGDRLRVDFFYHSEASREVVIRPDGKITLPIKGDFAAAGLTPSELKESVYTAFSDFFNEPIVTISVEESARTEDLKDTLSSIQRGRAKLVSVGPDGKVYLPFLPGLDARGLTVDQLRESINVHYSRRFGSLSVSVLLDEMLGNRTFVFGEVPKPGILPGNLPQTALQAVASAGGPLPTSALNRIKVLYWDEENRAHVRTLDFNEIYKDPSKDIMLPKNSTIYVPPSSITVADRFMDQYLRKLLLFNGTSLGFSYELHADNPYD
ncbi:polysaccharide biosynthesis/export family protein [Thiohalobacter sp. IOR34]|uniref:polysaccharide biosynthesis/export family protein n=1 Tax=Thiohalobacter sp. IOR34 TaxID=3057176 RepID=UPI0025B143D5|nr:polysaccharide biosynthesis/export family protein [Thiohalobacter sp. IOR34]WJW76300.1 polysaccharide biosynthesis/export family protein [Thiohalobacter sp. IOR34]